mgnify:CR=1 FL=1
MILTSDWRWPLAGIAATVGQGYPESMVLNPEYKSAPYELRFVSKDGKHIEDPYPHRFIILPPDDLWENGELEAWKCVSKHSIPKFKDGL